MTKFLMVILILFLSTPVFLTAATLQDIYNAATPGMGYDKLLELHRDSIYLGGISISNETAGIKGHGAIIDLQGSSITITGTSTLDIDACVIINGNHGIEAQDATTALVTQCTFYNNQIGISYMATSGQIEVINTILANNSQYGFACEEHSQRTLHYVTTYQNWGGDYMEWCSG
jgi:hypothetical protein